MPAPSGRARMGLAVSVMHHLECNLLKHRSSERERPRRGVRVWLVESPTRDLLDVAAAQRGSLPIVLLVLTTLAVALIFTGIRVAVGLSIEKRPNSGVSNSQYSAMIADAMVAQTTDLIGGAGPKSSATLTWTDKDGSFHYAHYALINGEIRREHDGLTTTVARGSTAARFSRDGKTLTFEFDLQTSDGTEERSIEVFASSLQ